MQPDPKGAAPAAYRKLSDQIIRDFEAFLSRAPPEGRKVSDALYDIAMQFAGQLASWPDDQLANVQDGLMAKFRAAAESAAAAEARRLPVFEGTPSDAKRMVTVMLNQLNRYGLKKHAGGARPGGASPQASAPQAAPPAPGRHAAAVVSMAAELRQAGNRAFGNGTHASLVLAVQTYTAAIKTDLSGAEKHLTLANRSAAYVKLGAFAAACRDAALAVQLQPAWAKAHLRMAAGLMGLKRGAAAVAAADVGLAVAPGDADLLRIKSEALALPAARPCTVAGLECAPRLQHAPAVRIVDPSGGGDFVGLVDAILACAAEPPPAGAQGWSIVLMPGGEYAQFVDIRSTAAPGDADGDDNDDDRELEVDAMLTARAPSIQLQIIGEKPNVTLSCTDALRAATKITTSLIRLSGAGVSLVLENLCLTVGAGILGAGHVSHCVSLGAGARLSLNNVKLFSPDSSAIGATGAGTTVEMRDCVFKKASGAILLDAGAAMVAERTRFEAARMAAVEIRGAGSTGRCAGCVFLGCSRQAAVMGQGGQRLMMEDCSFSRCGAKPSAPVLLVESGQLQLRRCAFGSLAGTAVVVQDSRAGDDSAADPLAAAWPAPSLLMDACTFADCDDVANFFGGYGLVSGCTVDKTARGPVVMVHRVTAGKKISLRKNLFRGPAGPGPGVDIVIATGEAAARAQVEVVQDDAAPACVRTVSDEECAKMEAMVRRMGM